jgi:hypothetical protein
VYDQIKSHTAKPKDNILWVDNRRKVVELHHRDLLEVRYVKYFLSYLRSYFTALDCCRGSECVLMETDLAIRLCFLIDRLCCWFCSSD